MINVASARDSEKLRWWMADRDLPWAPSILLGEETSWGQHYFGWETGGWFESFNDQGETNFHNTERRLARPKAARDPAVRHDPGHDRASAGEEIPQWAWPVRQSVVAGADLRQLPPVIFSQSSRRCRRRSTSSPILPFELQFYRASARWKSSSCTLFFVTYALSLRGHRLHRRRRR
jgi:hypothetical protein